MARKLQIFNILWHDDRGEHFQLMKTDSGLYFFDSLQDIITHGGRIDAVNKLAEFDE